MRRTRERSTRAARPLGNRRGATLVVVAIILSVILGLAALAVDMSRMYAFKSQLKTLADAAALSEVVDMNNSAVYTDANANAIALAATNRLTGGATATLASQNISYVIWDFNADPSTQVPTPSTWANANAVMVSPSYPAAWTLAKMFGVTSKTLSTSSVAARMYSSASSCLMPIAVPYITLINALNAVLGTSYTISHVLNESDIANLSRTGEVKLDWSKGATTPGNFGWLQVSSGKNENQVMQDTNCASDTYAIGNPVAGTTGAFNSNSTGIDFLCGNSGNGATKVACVSKPPIQIVLYKDTPTCKGSSCDYVIKYIAGLVLTAQDNKSLYGTFRRANAATGASVTTTPGPLSVSVLVQ